MSEPAPLPDGYTRFGLTSGNSKSISDQLAIKEAIKLSGLTAHVSPASYDNFLEHVSMEIIDRVLVFSIHARRVLEIENTRDLNLQRLRWVHREKPVWLELETNLWKAVNIILHARHLVVIFANAEGKQFENLGDAYPILIEIRSDRSGFKHVEPYGLCWSYLTRSSSNLEQLKG